MLRNLRDMERAREVTDESDTRSAAGGSMPSGRIPKTIGSYELLETLGEGGLGTVYLAQQHEPVRRRVALKVIKAGMDTKHVVARFEAERQALAVMDHPHVAKVFDGGATPEGRPYFVMELVAGEPITVYCDKNKLSMEDRLGLFMGVCEAVQHAHQKGIIHRDLKPSNVLVTVKEGKPVPKVIDFGIAKAINQRLTEQSIFTERGMLIGTPEYMSPEQAEMGATDVDTRTDIYSLGVLLYELLTGTLPFDSKTLRRAGYAEIQRIIRDIEPPKPSTRLNSLKDEISRGGLNEGNVCADMPNKPFERIGVPAVRSKKEDDTSLVAVAGRRRCDPKTLMKAIRGDLDWIVMKCLEKDRTRRYETANAVALEIRGHLMNEPVLASPPSASYRVRKFIRRKRGTVIASVIIFMTLIGGVIGTSIGFIRARQQRDRAEEALAAEADQRREADQARDRAVKIREFLVKSLRSQDPMKSGNQDILVSEAMRQTTGMLDGGELITQPEIEAELLGVIAEILNNAGKSGEAEPLARRALEMRKRIHPGDHADVASSLGNVGVCVNSLGRSAEALPEFEAALEMRQRLFKGDHPDVAESLNNVADCFLYLGRPAEALSKCEAALEMFKRYFNGDHAEVARSLMNVADCLDLLGRFAEALPKHEAALEMSQRLFKGDHIHVAQGLNKVANGHRSLGRSAEALPKFMAALEMRQRLFKGDHPDVAESLNNVAACLASLGRSAEALPNYEAALGMLQRLYESDHPHVALCLYNVGSSLSALGRSAEALPKIEAALEMFRRVLPAGHSNTLYVQIGLAYQMVATKQFAKAELLLLDAAAQCEKSAQSRQLHWPSVLKNTVKFYDAWHIAEPDRGYDKKAAEWRIKLTAWQATTQPAATQPN